MWSARFPGFSASEVAEACASGLRDKELAQRLRSAKPQIDDNSKALVEAAKTHKLHSVTREAFSVDTISDDGMIKIYDLQLGKGDRPASHIRNKLLASGPFELCCYCRQGQALTLDHFLPKTERPTFAIDPWNLVPACYRCNKQILAHIGSSPEDEFLHPYAMPDIGRWLYATVKPGDPVAITFTAVPDQTLDSSIKLRIAHEFRKLKLASFFTVISAPDIAETNATLVRSFPAGSTSAVNAHLLDAAENAFQADENARRGALFEALASDTAYCAGGYGSTKPLETRGESTNAVPIVLRSAK